MLQAASVHKELVLWLGTSNPSDRPKQALTQSGGRAVTGAPFLLSDLRSFASKTNRHLVLRYPSGLYPPWLSADSRSDLVRTPFEKLAQNLNGSRTPHCEQRRRSTSSLSSNRSQPGAFSSLARRPSGIVQRCPRIAP